MGRLTVQRSRAKEAASQEAMASRQEAPAASPALEAVNGWRIARGNPIAALRAGLVLVPERRHLHPTSASRATACSAGYLSFRISLAIAIPVNPAVIAWLLDWLVPHPAPDLGRGSAGFVFASGPMIGHVGAVAAGFAGFRSGCGGDGAAEREDRRWRPAILLFPARSQQPRKHHQHRVRNADRGSRWDAATCSRPAVSSLVNSSRQVRPGKTPEYGGESAIVRVVK